MKQILIPTDFSENAYNALYYATRLFKKDQCKFYLLNTWESQTPVLSNIIDTNHGDQQLEQESKQKLTETLHAIVRDTEDFDHTFEAVSTSKKLLETIEREVKNKGIDLIVMGTKGATGAKGFFMGSNTSNIIERIKCCPVLVVPDEFNFEDISEVAFSEENSAQ